MQFAERTGLLSRSQSPRRDLLTDAFAVCNFLERFRQTREEQCHQAAHHLVSQVHRVPGRHRQDDSRQGWISGLEEQEGARHLDPREAKNRKKASGARA